MKNLMTITFLFALLFHSCNEPMVHNDELVSSNREILFDGLSIKQQKIVFNGLSDSEKKSLWIDKIDHVIKQDLENDQIEALKEISDLLQLSLNFESVREDYKFKQALLKLAKNTSYEDYLNIFMDLRSFESYKISKTNQFQKAALNNILITSFEEIKLKNKTGSRLEKETCNCSWTCDDDSPFYTTDCEETSMGCGFLFLFSCKTYS